MRKQEILDKLWKKFEKFMFGQTVMRYDDGETNYFKSDVDRFLSNLP